MTIRLGVIMDPIAHIHYPKDSTLAMLLAAEAKGWEIQYFEQQDLYLKDGIAYGRGQKLKVFLDPKQWFQFGKQQEMPLSDLQIILMRKDPPFNEEYIYSTYFLEHAESQGVFVVNKPQALRDANEKMFASWFPQCCPPTLVTRNIALIKSFWQEQGDIVCKPLSGMGGKDVFRLTKQESNASAIFSLLTANESQSIMAQKFIPEIKQGDKRIILINGEPIPYALARVPQGEDWRGNLAVGAKGVAQPLTKRDEWIISEVAPVLRERGLYFVGLDVIGDYLTEINVTSPTGIRELDAQCKINIGDSLINFLEQKIIR